MEKQIGTIEEGKDADLVILDLDTAHPPHSPDPVDAVVQLAQPQDIKTVIVAGRVVMEDGKVLTVDEQEVKTKVEELRKKYRED
jgi:cytosine/adenosine deaminase-related metal-dependent hydrolase